MDLVNIADENDLSELMAICNKAYSKAVEKELPKELLEMSSGNPQGDEQASYLQAARGEGFEINGAVWNYWSRKLKDAAGQPTKLAKDYALVVGRIQKKEFRNTWGKLEFKDMLAKKEHAEQLVRTTEAEKEWYTFGGLVVLFGGWKWQPAVKGACMHAAKAARMGPTWCRKEDMIVIS
jgi:hypothetical protein